MKKLFTLLASAALCMLLPAAASAAGNQTIGGVVYQFDSSDNTYTVAASPDAMGTVALQAYIDGYPVTKIAAKAFQGNTDLLGLSMPYTITEIGEWAFAECPNMEQITLSPSITEIPASCFYSSGLTECVVPEGVTAIGADAFKECDIMQELILPSTLKTVGRDCFDGLASASSASSCIIACYAATPPTADGTFGTYTREIQVLSESRNNYKSASGWSDYATNIKSIPIVDGPFVLDGVTYYQNGSSIEVTNGRDAKGNVTIHKMVNGRPVTSVSYGVFSSNKLITTVAFPETVTELPDAMFTFSPALTAVSLPSGITKIGDRMFTYCEALTKCDIPSGVTEIGPDAFHRCTSLTTLTLPASLTKLGESCFFEMGGSTAELTCLATTPPSADARALDRYTGTIRVPAASLDAYKAADGWSTVASQIKAIAGTQSKFTIESNYTIFNFVADGDNNPLPVDVYDDGKLVTWNIVESSDAYIRVSDSNVECGFDNSSGFYIKSSAAGSGTVTVGYKDAEKTFAYNFYNMEFDISPASVSVAVGESATFAGTLRFTMPGKEPVIANDITLGANMRKNGTGMTGSGEYFKLEPNGASVTLTVLADPGEGDFSIYTYRSRFSAPGEGYWEIPMSSAVIPVTIAGAEPVVEIVSDFDTFGFALDPGYTGTYALPIFVYEDGKQVSSSLLQADGTLTSTGGAQALFVDFNTGQVAVQPPTTKGASSFTVTYKGVSRTFEVKNYNCQVSFTPEGTIAMAVGEQKQVSVKLILSGVGSEEIELDPTTLYANPVDATSHTGYKGDAVKVTCRNNVITVSVTAAPEQQLAIGVTPVILQDITSKGWFKTQLDPRYIALDITEPEPEPVVLAVALPNGTVNISDADKRETPLAIVADQGWKISTVTLGGDDITSQLSDEGAYTVPVLTESKALNVVFVQETQTAVADLDASEAPKVYAAGGEVRIEGAEPGAEVRVYDLAGRCLMVTTDHVFAAPGRGVRILTVAGRTYKFAL